MSLHDQLYSTKTMTNAVIMGRTARSFLQQRFFSNIKVHDADKIQIDIVRNGQRLAPFVNRRMQGKIMEGNGFKTHEYSPPLLKPKRVTTADQLHLRLAGEAPYVSMGPEERAQQRLANELAELDDMITRRVEWMCGQAIQHGIVPVVGSGVEEEIDFDMKSDHHLELSGTDKWDASSTATPLDDLQDWVELINRSGAAASDVILGTAAMKSFLKTQQILGGGSQKSIFDLAAVNIGSITPEILASGATWYGRIAQLGCDLWTYPEIFKDEKSNLIAPMIEEDRVIVLSRSADYRLHYGPIDEVPAPVIAPRYVKSWTENDPPIRYLMVMSRPLPAPHEIDSIVSVKVQ